MIENYEYWKKKTVNLPSISTIRELVKEKHQGQFDISGKSYYQYHLCEVATNAHLKSLSFIKNYFIENNIRINEWVISYYCDLCEILGYCHDLYEDTNITDEELKSIGCEDYIIDILKNYLTHIRFTPYKEYIDKISTNVFATIVKLGDLKNNLDLSRLHGKKLEEKDFKRIQKYLDAYDYLLNKLKEFKL